MTDVGGNPTAEIRGQRWVLTQIHPRDAVQVELLLAHVVLGPLAEVLRTLAETVVRDLVAIAREHVEGDDGEPDLEALLELRGAIDTSDPRVKKAWRKLTEIAPETAGEVIARALPVLAAELGNTGQVLLMFELALFGACPVAIVQDGQTKQLAKGPKGWQQLAGLVDDQGHKWAVLWAQLVHNYGDQLAAWVGGLFEQWARDR